MRRFNSNIGWGGIFFIVLFAAVQLHAVSQLSTAPVNPDFIAWQTKALESSLESSDQDGHPLGHIPSPVDRSHLQSQTQPLLDGLEGTIPSSYDLRALGHVTAVKDQNDCGSCWTFASYGSLESWLLKNESETWDFSENHLKNYHGFDLAPCSGGNVDMSTAYLARWAGPVDESDDPYHDWDNRPSPGGVCRKYFKKTLWFFTDTVIKNALITHGAMYVSMRWSSSYYNPSTYTYYYSGSGSTNHGVTLVGWDDDKVVPGAPGNGAWLIKNSWGTDWGDNGYFWISYYDTRAVVYAAAFCDAVSHSTYYTNYQYDPLGWTVDVGYDSLTGWAANIFTATANEKLQAVAFYAVDDNISYEIYIYDNFSGGTFSTLLGSTLGTLNNSGYHTITLPSAIDLTNGDDFAIVVKFTTTGYGYPIPVEMDFPGYSSAATAGPGQSYVSDTGTTFVDITSIGGLENANVCIKGLTIPPGPIAPEITSSPPLTVIAAQPYSYNVYATGFPPTTDSFTTYPSGMTINSNSGQILWTPQESQIGTADVVVVASNTAGSDSQGFTITVSGIAPVITSSPVETARVGWLYSYDVDVDANVVPAPVYSLTTHPAGMTINPGTGLIQWTPHSSQIGMVDVVVDVDNVEGFDTQSFTIDVSPEDVYNVKYYGAHGCGYHHDTDAINHTIDVAVAHGGGFVYFPPGTYLSGSIILKSNVILDLHEDATIKATMSRDYTMWDPFPCTMYHDWGHCHWKCSLIWAVGQNNIGIIGSGLIDGTNPDPELNGTYTGLDKGDPDPNFADRALSFKNCTGITIDGIKILRGGHFAIIASGCTDVDISNVLVDTNRDGINIDCCNDVTIINCRVNSPCDDAICLKSSTSLCDKIPTENVIISGCTVSGYDVGSVMNGSPFPDTSCYSCGSIKFGTESYGGFKNITITDCTFENSRGFMLATVDGGDIENIYIDNIQMYAINDSPIFLRLGNWGRGPGPPPPGTYRNVNISNLTCYFGMSKLSGIASGIPGHYIEDVNLSNLNITYSGGRTKADAGIVLPENVSGYPYAGMFGGVTPCYGFYCRHVKNIEFNDVDLSFYYDDERPVFTGIDVNGVKFDNLQGDRSYGNPEFLMFDDVANIDINNCDFSWVTTDYGQISSSTNKAMEGEPFDITVEAISEANGISTNDMFIDSNFVKTKYMWLDANEWSDVVFKGNRLYEPGLHKIEIGDSQFYQGICLYSDFNLDYKVDLLDYAFIAGDWQQLLDVMSPSQEPAAWWKFDEGSGIHAYDSGFYRNIGTLTNMYSSSWVEGVFGGALEFDGFNDYVEVADHPSMSFGSGSFTFSAWIKTSQWASTGYIIINGSSGGGYSGKRYSLRHKGSMTFAIDDDRTKSTATSSGVINDDKWHHIAAIRDRNYYSNGRSKGLNIYVDGYLRGNGSDYTGNIDSPGEPLYIGKDGIDSTTGFLDGVLDDVRLYDYALSQQELNTLIDTIYVPTATNLCEDGNGVIDAFDVDVFSETWLCNGNNIPEDVNISEDFAVTFYKANVPVADLLDAIDVYLDANLQDGAAFGTSKVINFLNTGDNGHYGGDSPFPGTAIGTDEDNFIVVVTGTIDVPLDGEWTFGVNSDDGFYLDIDYGNYTSYHLFNRNPSDTLQVFDLTQGEHDVFMLFWGNTGGSELELFAAYGDYSSGFDPGEFALIGDVLNGKISVVAGGP